MCGNIGKDPGSIFRISRNSACRRPDMGQGSVDEGQQYSCDHPRLDGLPHNGALLLHPLCPDIQGNDNSEIKGGNGIHGLISLQKSLNHRS